MIITCIKDVIMEGTEIVAFVEGEEYWMKDTGGWYETVDEQSQDHAIARNGDWEWFNEHFKKGGNE